MPDKHIPIPPAFVLSPLRGQLKALEVGDSFLIEQRYRTSIFTYAKKVGIKITTRTDGDKIRVWRVA